CQYITSLHNSSLIILSFFFFSLLPQPPRSTLFPYTTLFRSHTNDAPSSITRLLDLKVPGFLITSTVIGILAQRLVRVICSHCAEDRKSTRLNSSHSQISYAVFCLKKKKKITAGTHPTSDRRI